MMTALDRNVLEQWAEHGVPFDQATCGNARTIARSALDEIYRLNTIINDLLEAIGTAEAFNERTAELRAEQVRS